MNKHIKLVREFHEVFSHPQTEQGASDHLSDMDIIMRQALLMEGGSQTLKAIKAGDMVLILSGLVNLAYFALAAIALRDKDVVEHSVSWRHDGFVISVMRLLSDKINQCTTGSADHYSDVYCVCVHLTNSFLNADFDKAFQKVHQYNLSQTITTSRSLYDILEDPKKTSPMSAPDLSDCLFE